MCNVHYDGAEMVICRILFVPFDAIRSNDLRLNDIWPNGFQSLFAFMLIGTENMQILNII